MTIRAIWAGGLMLSLLGAATQAWAGTVIFSGSRMNIDAPGAAAARCGSRATANIRHDPPTATSTGLSNLGAFTPTLSHCIQLPPSMAAPTPFDLGEFRFDFASGDALFGTYSGSLSPGVPGVFSVTQTHIVTGGTGFFLGATGSFASSGVLSFLAGRPTVQQNFAGTLNVPGVPEPTSWAMMIVGFGVVGAAVRRRRRVAAAC